MLKINELKLENNENNSDKEKIIKKIYNQGDIILSIQESPNEIYQINLKPKQSNDFSYINQHKSKSLLNKNKHNSSNNNSQYKTIKKQVEEMYNQIQKEIDEMDSDEEEKNKIGNILKDFFSDEELSDSIKFGPNPLKNLYDSLNPKTDKKVKKPYIPDLQIYSPKVNKNIIHKKYDNNKYNVNKKEEKKPKEINLQKIIDIWKENEKIVKNINELYNRFLREEKIRKEKERKKELLKELNKNKNKEKNNKVINIIISEESIKEDKSEKVVANNEEDKKEENNINNMIINLSDNEEDKKNEEININKQKYIFKKEDLAKIIDISKDKKYIDAKKYMKKTKENCEKVNDLILEINHKIREDKNSIGNNEFKLIKKPKIELENKAKHIVEQVKSDIIFSSNYFNNNKK